MYKIIIADDEEIECQALEMMIKNNFEDMEVVPYAETGIELMTCIEKYQPHIAVVDINMPGMSGLEALNMMRARHKKMKIIIQSAYSDFQYSRQALQLGVTEYLLKPVTAEELIGAIKKVCQLLDQEQREEEENSEIMKLSKEMQEIVENQLMSSLLRKKPDEKSFGIYCKALKFEFCGCLFLLFRIKDGQEEIQSEEKRMQNLEKIRHILEKQMRNYSKCLTQIYQGEIFALIFPEGEVRKDNYKNWIFNIFKILHKSVMEKMQCKLIAGVSQWKDRFLLIQAGVNECRMAVKGKKEEGIYFWNLERNQVTPGTDYSEKIRRMLYFIKRPEEVGLREEEDKLFQNFRDHHLPLSQRACVCVEILTELINELEDGGENLGIYQWDHRIDWRNVLQPTDEADLQFHFHNYLEKIKNERIETEKEYNEYVERTLLYLETHYYEDITLESAAENAGITSFYLSRLLRQELDQTFVEILTDIRIRKALRVLKDREKSIKTAAAEAGYTNITYFYKVFKKHTGMSVGEYRDFVSQ